jgi:hypothetical protein
VIAEQLFGDIIFALKGAKPDVGRVWQKRCAVNTEWNILPRNNLKTRECGYAPLKLEKCNGS